MGFFNWFRQKPYASDIVEQVDPAPEQGEPEEAVVQPKANVFDWFRFRQDIYDKLFFSVQHVHGNDVVGDIAEFGTMSGETASILAEAIAACETRWGYHLEASKMPPKQLHLFDSFVGLPETTDESDRNSPHVLSGVWKPGSCRVLTSDQLLAVCEAHVPQTRITIHDGWFSDTVGKLPANSLFSLLHVDCDLYSSTMDALTPLFARGMIAPGAIILFDDWDCNYAAPEFGERKAWAECVERFNIRFSDCGAYGFASHRFIVHSYDKT